MDTLGRDMQKALDMSDEMEKTLQQPARRYIKNAKAMLRTPADIYEHPSYYSYVLDMPGLEVSNIKVRIDNGILHVAGKKKKMKATAENEGAKPIRIERRRARYMRKFTLPENSNPEDVKATYKDGVLTVTVAKMRQPKIVAIPIS